MSNEEKVLELKDKYYTDCNMTVGDIALEMAAWKDQQFQAILDRMDASVIGGCDPEFVHGARFIISELRSQLDLD